MINTLSIMFMASLISGHFQIRFKEYLEIEGELTPKKVEENLNRIIRFIHQLLRPSGSRPEIERQEDIHVRRFKG